MGYEYQEKFVDKANEILANQMKTKPEWIDRKALIKALEADFNTDWADYASKNNFDKDYIDGVRDEYDDVLNVICKQPAADVNPVKYSSWEYCTYPIVDRDGTARRCKKGYVCKACGHGEPEEKRFCGGCGAEMRGEDNG